MAIRLKKTGLELDIRQWAEVTPNEIKLYQTELLPANHYVGVGHASNPSSPMQANCNGVSSILVIVRKDTDGYELIKEYENKTLKNFRANPELYI